MIDAKETLVIIVGSGASVEAGIPGTRQLGEIAKKALPNLVLPGVAYGDPAFRLDQVIPMANVLDSALRADYADYDFEILLHALEELETFTEHRYSISPNANRPVLASFAEIMRRFETLADTNLVREARWAALRAIHKQVGEASLYPITGPRCKEAREQLDRLFSKVAERFRLVVIDLNYDDLVDAAGIEWNDGFADVVPGSSCSLFSPHGMGSRHRQYRQAPVDARARQRTVWL